MPLYKFEDFIFDSSSHKLSHKGTKVEIRPKALKLLNLLIQNRHRILSKTEIMSSIWGCDYARDHLLFQLISELRKHPLQREFVRTQPNEGYQWNVATKTVDKGVFVPQLIAASFATALLCLSLMTLPVLTKVDNSPSKTTQLPAFSALSKGIIALENGDKNKAVQWFEFALLENPDSVESSIFLAETLYRQNRYEESAKYLQNVLRKTNTSPYNKATASHILSRISEQQGKFDDALRHAHESGQTNGLEQCSVDIVEHGIHRLENRLAMSPIRSEQDPSTENDNEPMSENYVKQCNELKSSHDETLSCQPLMTESIAYVIKMREPTLAIS